MNVEQGVDHLREVLLSVGVLIGLMVVEAWLYGLQGLARDAADLVTMCGFGGLAAAAILGQKSQTWPAIWAAGILGLIAALAVLHGSLNQPDGIRALIVGAATFASVFAAAQAVTPREKPAQIARYLIGVEFILGVVGVAIWYAVRPIDRYVGEVGATTVWLAAVMAAPLVATVFVYALATRKG
jgi:hypothetical protein